ncbi:MAG: VOC family protein [Solirubrobacteraceae bacterium]
MRISGSHPVLAVHDLDGSGAWYRDVLGCELDDPDPGNWRFCRAGEMIFMLGRCPDVPSAGELGDHSYVAYLRVDDVDGFYEQAVAFGADVLKAPTDEPWGMREIGVRSPDGHRFTLGQPIGPD